MNESLRVSFYALGAVDDVKLAYAVIMARHKGKWIFVRHRQRATWEIPGGRRESHEDILSAASRELFEESGAVDFTLYPICVYSVSRGENESYGQLFYAELEKLGELPVSEIEEVRLFDAIPENLTYPLIQPYLYEKVLEFI